MLNRIATPLSANRHVGLGLGLVTVSRAIPARFDADQPFVQDVHAHPPFSRVRPTMTTTGTMMPVGLGQPGLDLGACCAGLGLATAGAAKPAGFARAKAAAGKSMRPRSSMRRRPEAWPRLASAPGGTATASRHPSRTVRDGTTWS